MTAMTMATAMITITVNVLITITRAIVLAKVLYIILILLAIATAITLAITLAIVGIAVTSRIAVSMSLVPIARAMAMTKSNHIRRGSDNSNDRNIVIVVRCTEREFMTKKGIITVASPIAMTIVER